MMDTPYLRRFFSRIEQLKAVYDTPPVLCPAVTQIQQSRQHIIHLFIAYFPVLTRAGVFIAFKPTLDNQELGLDYSSRSLVPRAESGRTMYSSHW